MTGLDRIHAAARAELARAPRARRWWVDAMMLVAIGTLVTGLAIAVLGPNEAQHGSAQARWGTAGLLGFVLVAGAVWGLKPGVRAGPTTVVALVVVGLVAVVLAGSGLAADVTAARELRCAVMEWLLSGLPVAMALWALSRFDVDGRRTIATTGAAGAVGALALHLHCPNGALVHLAAFHALPWAGLVAAAVLLRRRLPSSTFAP